MKFVFIMQHPITPEQRVAASTGGNEVVELTKEAKSLLNVPDDPSLGREWFSNRADAILASVGGVGSGDTAHIMGQAQLASATQAAARKAGATLVESVTPRTSVEKTLPDGKVEKTNIFSFAGFRTVHEY